MRKLIKRLLKKVILRIIRLVECYELRGLSLDQNDISKKIIYSEDLSNINVFSDSGYVNASQFHLTQPYNVWFIETESGLHLDCADLHILFDSCFNEIYVSNLEIGDYIQTKNGLDRISYIENTMIPVCMVDLSIDHPDHRYYTNDILSHNTVTSSIYLLWYLLFNFEKNAMILANIGDTATELMDKIKIIARGLPFFLKPGILIYNVMTMKFDNGCRIMAKTTTKQTSIGFTIHFLYMDEFAHINANFINLFFKSVYPTISSSLISRIIITSTPNGMNKFYDIYSAAIEGKNEFNPIRVDWWQVPGRDEEWKKREIANMGSEEDFNQEYGNQFLSSSKLLLDSYTLKKLKKTEIDYIHKELIPFKNSTIEYDNLKWHPSFDPTNLWEDGENKRFVISIDTAGGGGGDYTVVNILKVSPRPLSSIIEKKFFEDESDFFCLLQIGLFRSNTIQIEELKAFLEILCTEVFNPEQIKIVVEVDYRGEYLIEKLIDGEKFYSEMFVFTKHTESSKQLKMGVKVTPKTKEKYCEDLKINTRNTKIIPTEKTTIMELSNFGETSKGIYQSQIGKDDIAMTLVNANSVFEYEDFTYLVMDIFDTIPEKYKDAINKKMTENTDIQVSGTTTSREMETYNVFKDFF